MDAGKSIFQCHAHGQQKVNLVLQCSCQDDFGRNTKSKDINTGSQTRKNMGKTVTPFEHKLMGSGEVRTSWDLGRDGVCAFRICTQTEEK